MASNANNDTPYISSKHIEEAIHSLEEASKVLFKWLGDNLTKITADKNFLLVNTSDKVNIRIENIDICNSKCE